MALWCDEQDLRPLTEAHHLPAEPQHVLIVQRGVYLVQDAERRWPDLQQRQDQRGRDQRPFAARQRGELLGPLAGRPHRELHPGLFDCRWATSSVMCASPPPKSSLKVSLNAAFIVSNVAMNSVCSWCCRSRASVCRLVSAALQVGNLPPRVLHPAAFALVFRRRQRVDEDQAGRAAAAARRSVVRSDQFPSPPFPPPDG